jgi:hypothetical protein
MSENANIGSTEDFNFGYSAENYDAGCEWTELPNEPDYSDPDWLIKSLIDDLYAY